MDSTKDIRYLRFDGKGLELFGIYLSNAFLTLITLGMYSFWAKIKVRRYIYQHTSFLDSRFDFHATGKERSLGFFRALMILLLPLAAVAAGVYFAAVKKFIPLSPQDVLNYGLQAISAIVAIFFFLATPYLVVGKRRFLMSRTSWRNIRFRFIGKGKALLGIYASSSLYSILSLGLYYPWYRCRLRRFFATNTLFGGEPFDFRGRGQEYLMLNLRGVLLSILTLGVGAFWWEAAAKNFLWRNTYFQDKPIASSLTGSKILWVRLKSLCLIVFTLGLGFPYAIVMNKRLLLEHLGFEGEPDFARIRGSLDKGASTLADGFSEISEGFDALTELLP